VGLERVAVPATIGIHLPAVGARIVQFATKASLRLVLDVAVRARSCLLLNLRTSLREPPYTPRDSRLPSRPAPSQLRAIAQLSLSLKDKPPLEMLWDGV